MGKEHQTIVEWSDPYLRVIDFEKKESQNIYKSSAIVDMRSKTDQQISEELKQVIKSCLGKKNTTLLINRRHVILNRFVLPSYDDDELRKMAMLQIVARAPYGREDLIVDFVPLDEKDATASVILAAAVQKSLIERYLSVMKTAGSHPTSAAFSSFGIWKIYKKMAKDLTSEINRSALVVFFDESQMEVCFCDSVHLFFSRSLPYGQKDCNGPTMDEIIRQISLTVGSYEREAMGPAIGTVWVLSYEDENSQFKEKLISTFKKQCVYINPGHALDARGLTAALSKAEYNLGSGIGFLLDGTDVRLNLLPEQVKNKKAGMRRQKKAIQFIVLGLLVFLLGAGAFSYELYKKWSAVQGLESRNKDLAGLTDQAQEKRRRLALLQERQQKPLVVDALRELSRRTPAEVAYTSFELGQDGSLVLQGEAQSAEAVQELKDNLSTSPVFKNVKLSSVPASGNAGINGPESTTFKMTCKL